jgi:hypothetical protein
MELNMSLHEAIRCNLTTNNPQSGGNGPGGYGPSCLVEPVSCPVSQYQALAAKKLLCRKSQARLLQLIP